MLERFPVSNRQGNKSIINGFVPWDEEIGLRLILLFSDENQMRDKRLNTNSPKKDA